MSDVGRWIRTIRHLRAGQVTARVQLAVRRRLWERRGSRIDAAYRRRAAALGPARFDRPGLAAVASYRASRRPPEACERVARDAVAGRFTFLGSTVQFGDEVAWHRPDLDRGTRLWKSQLHEFPYALDLALCARTGDGAVFRRRLLALLRSWDEASPIGRTDFAVDCWNARVCATRTIHLCVAASLLELAPEESSTMGALLARHALFLEENLERDLLGNHLLRDAVGLVFAASVFGTPDRHLPLLREQVDEQVLADGCHIERSPLYHAIVLEDLFETRLLLGADSPDWLRDAVLRMAGFLTSLLHGDGDLPLFGDTWLGEVDVAHLLGAVRALPEARSGLPAPPEIAREGGLIALERGRSRLVVRAGPHGPDYQLGHAHGDLLSFELSIGGARVVVDTGTLTYDPGEPRSYLRSTAAHNTVEVDGRDQLETWASFRAGRRGRARVVDAGREGRWSYLWATHDAYRRLPGRPEHHRLFAFAEGGLLVLDVVLGRGAHRMRSHVLLAPELPPDCPELAPVRGEARRSAAPWFPRWGRTLQATRVATESSEQLPWCGGWIVCPAALQGAGRLSAIRHPDAIRLHYRDDALGLEIGWLCASNRPGSLSLGDLTTGR